MELHRPLDLGLEIVEVGDRRSRDVGNAVRHGEAGEVLALSEHVAWLGADGLGRRRACCGWRGAGALHAGVHVGLVVVADEQHVVVALEHPREAAEADVDRPAVAGLGDDAHVVHSLHLQRGGDAGCDRGGVAEERVEPRDPPRGLGIGGREDLEAAGRVDRDELALGRPHRGVECVAGAERLAASLTGSMARVEGVRPVRVRLDCPVRLVNEAVADGEAADLVEAHGLGGHRDSSTDPGGDRAEVAKDVLGRRTRAPRSGNPGTLSLDDLVIEVEEGEAFEPLLLSRRRACPRANVG